MHASQIFLKLKIPVVKLKLKYYSTINYVRMQQCSTVFLWLCCVSKTDLQLQRYALHVRIGTILEDKTTFARSLILFGKKRNQNDNFLLTLPIVNFIKISGQFLRKIRKENSFPCRSVISIKLPCNFTEIALRQGCCPVNLLHIFRTPFPKTTFGVPLLKQVFDPINTSS